MSLGLADVVHFKVYHTMQTTTGEVSHAKQKDHNIKKMVQFIRT